MISYNQKRKKIIKTKAFTLAETVISTALFLMGITLVSQIFLTLVKGIVSAQRLQANIDNTRFGLEKIWNEIKTGSNFETSIDNNSKILKFKDRRCREIEIYQDTNNEELIFKVSNATTSITTSIFDKNLIKVKNFNYYFDSLDEPNSNDYTVSSRKLVNIHLELEFKTETGIIPYKIRTSITPLLSPRSSNLPCP